MNEKQVVSCLAHHSKNNIPICILHMRLHITDIFTSEFFWYYNAILNILGGLDWLLKRILICSYNSCCLAYKYNYKIFGEREASVYLIFIHYSCVFTVRVDQSGEGRVTNSYNLRLGTHKLLLYMIDTYKYITSVISVEWVLRLPTNFCP